MKGMVYEIQKDSRLEDCSVPLIFTSLKTTKFDRLYFKQTQII